MFTYFRDRRRRKLLAEPFPPYWETILHRNVAHYARLKADEQARLRDSTRVLVAEKEWEGVGGIIIVTDEMKITIAGQASLLLLGDKHDYFSRVPSIVVYPNSFRTPQQEDGWEDDFLSDTIAEGQAVYRGPVILGWEHVLAEGRNPACSNNVVLHEFAHQLDYLDDTVNGTPPLDNPELEARWKTVMTAAFGSHTAELKRGEETFFTEHAGENETEFFADATEVFFCRPADLIEENAMIYELFKDYFKVDPLVWFPK